MFYVYEWYIVETNEVIYVGKGTKNRYKVKKHNWLFQEYLENFNCSSRIIKYFENEDSAFDYEEFHINELQEKGQCKCNLCKGGTGGSTKWWTDDLREKYSKNNVMKSESQRERMRNNNPMSNPKIATKTNSQKCRAVIIGDKEYNSLKQACKDLNTSNDVIRRWCLKGINPKGQLCRYKDSPQVIFTDKRYNKGGCRSLTYNNKYYESPKDLAEFLEINVNRIYRWLKKGFDYNGNICLYNDDERIIHNYEYDNQQPSQTNFDNSSLEGSTTNR